MHMESGPADSAAGSCVCDLKRRQKAAKWSWREDSTEATVSPLVQENRYSPCSLVSHTATDLTLTAGGVETDFSCFSEQISGIIRLHSLPAEPS